MLSLRGILRKSMTGAILCGAVFLPTVLRSQQPAPWEVPAEAKKVKNPVPLKGETVQAIAPVYEQRCAGCHTPANGVSLKKLNDPAVLKGLTDGELFWKITHGRPPMPPYEELSEQQRWELVNYVRDLARRSGYGYMGARHTR